MTSSVIHSIAVILILLGAPMTLCGAAEGADCLNYGPAVVTLTGKITARTTFGPPNYGEDPAHDRREKYWYLTLDAPICVNGNGLDDPEMQSEFNVRTLQIVFDNVYPTDGGWIGHRASITGTLFHQITAHHHTRVLIAASRTVRVP
jgi:hypothetical protein